MHFNRLLFIWLWFLFTGNGILRAANGPILLLATHANFGLYTGEVLKAEGFNAFQIDSLSNTRVTLKFLKKFDLVILSETAITAKQKETLSAYVKAGGNLIAFKPDAKLNSIFGIRERDNALTDPYVFVDVASGIGLGPTPVKLQIHGPADRYNIDMGTVEASLSEDATKPTVYPAIMFNSYFNGHAIAFSYNLPRSIVLIRQGNYMLAGQEKDGINGIRAMDMFTDGWVDTTRNTINQADQHMHLLTHALNKLSQYGKPLPRLWYFPDSLKCLVTLNNDGEDSSEEEFEPQFNDMDSLGAKMTLYIKEIDRVSKAWTKKWIDKGFEISGHPDDVKQAGNPDWKTMNHVIQDLNKRLMNKYGIAPMETVTNHWFVWCGVTPDNKADFGSQARIEALNNIGLDCNYAHYDNNSNQGHFLGAMGYHQGNFTGSGIPMRFSDVNGNVIDIFQQINNVYDQQYMEHKDPEGYFSAFKGLMDRSLKDGIYSFISVKAHNNEYFFSKAPLKKMLLYAKEKQVPVWTEKQLLDFLKARGGTSFEDISWSDEVFSCDILSSIQVNNLLTCMIPAKHNQLSVKRVVLDGQKYPVKIERISGIDYAMIAFETGRTHSLKVYY